MATRDQIEAVASACIDLYEDIKAVGTPEMQALMRLLLHQIGRDLALRQYETGEVIHGPWEEKSE